MLERAKKKNISKTSQKIFKKVQGFGKKIITTKRTKGSFKDPFFYLGLTAVFLFLITCFVNPSELLCGEIVKDFSLLKAQSTNTFCNQTKDLFVNQSETSQLESPELTTIQDSSIKGISPPTIISSKVLGSLIGSDYNLGDRKETIEYEVQEGDTLSSITNEFNISLNTILWANDLSSRSLIRPGQKLIILPTSGLMHLVQRGDTLGNIAKKYKAEIEEITDINDLPEQGEIFVGDLLIIPNGIMSTVSDQTTYAPLAASYFICPIPAPCRITQGLHPYNAIDFSNGKCADPVYAAAGGKVQKTGYGNIAGIYVRVLHPNGVVTFYGHLSKILVGAGDHVYQGQIIGYIGYTGYTIPSGPGGCHLHFEVRGARNPFAK